MIGALALCLALVAQQDTVVALSPRARAMLDRFPLPRGVDVSVDTRFSDDTVWLGQQVELVTATWFRRDLRERLRRQPSLRTPSLSGLWSAPASATPILAQTVRQDGAVYDLYVSHQTLFPLGAGVIEAPPAVLTFAVPSSTSFFAPEERKSVSSRPARLVVREIPSGLAAELGSGPTARGISVRWSVPSAPVTVGTPVTVELVVAGQGNVALWPTPDVSWPRSVRVYTEPTDEQVRRPGGIVAGEKHFRYTLVTDSAGVVTLPRVRYPYFDPQARHVAAASAAPVAIAMRAGAGQADRPPISGSSVLRTPVASIIVRRGWPFLALLALAPLALAGWRRRRRVVPRARAPEGSLEERLRRALDQPADASPGRVELALRRRGVSREEAARVRRWVEAVERERWSPGHPAAPESADVGRILERLGSRGAVMVTALLLAAIAGVSAPLGAQWREAVTRYRDGDAAGAARLFAMVTRTDPASPDAWLDLGAAHWRAGDDVGATAAWLQGLDAAPRDWRLRDALEKVPHLPASLLARAPIIPLSRDELVLVALVAWLGFWLVRRRASRVGLALGGVAGLAAVIALSRTATAARDEALVRSGAVMRVSPIPTAPGLGDVPVWAVVSLERRQDDWWLVRTADDHRGWIPENRLAPLSPLD